jgi:hypothetical protein
MILSRLFKNKRQCKHKHEDYGADTCENINHAIQVSIKHKTNTRQ